MSTPLEAIHKFCVACVGSPFEVRDCGGESCPGSACLFYKFRTGNGRPSVRLVRRYCVECMGGDKMLVREYPDLKDHNGQPVCALHPFRMGRNPNYNPAMADNLKRRFRLGGGMTADFAP